MTLIKLHGEGEITILVISHYRSLSIFTFKNKLIIYENINVVQQSSSHFHYRLRKLVARKGEISEQSKKENSMFKIAIILSRYMK